MEFTVKRDIKIDSDDVLRRLSNYINAVDKKNWHIYVRSETLKDVYDLIKYLISSKKKPIKKEYYLGDLIYFTKTITIDIHDYYTEGNVYKIIRVPADSENGCYILEDLQSIETVNITKGMLDHCAVNLRNIPHDIFD